MDLQGVIDKFDNKEEISIGKIQIRFSVGFNTAKDLFNELIDRGIIVMKNNTDKYYKATNNQNALRIIFLDIDGVLNCNSTKDKVEVYRGIEDEKVLLLKKIVDKTNAKIILISSWKEWWFKGEKNKSKQDSLANYLDEKLAKVDLKISDKINDSFSLTRGSSVRKYLDGLKSIGVEVHSFVILDNESDGYKEHKLTPYLIQTSFNNGGLMDKHANKAIEMLLK